MILKGKCVSLNQGISEDGYRAILGWYTDPEIIAYISWAKDVMDFSTTDDVKSFMGNLKDGIFFEISTHDGKMIGYITLSHFRERECSFGIIIGEKAYWGKGMGLEAIRIMAGYAFKHLNLERMLLSTSEFHERALRLYAKAGFEVVSNIPDSRTVYHKGEWVQSGTLRMELTRERFLRICVPGVQKSRAS